MTDRLNSTHQGKEIQVNFKAKYLVDYTPSANSELWAELALPSGEHLGVPLFACKPTVDEVDWKAEIHKYATKLDGWYIGRFYTSTPRTPNGHGVSIRYDSKTNIYDVAVSSLPRMGLFLEASEDLSEAYRMAKRLLSKYPDEDQQTFNSIDDLKAAITEAWKLCKGGECARPERVPSIPSCDDGNHG